MTPFITKLVLYFVPMLLSLTVHECAHALSAYWLGDETAREQGRLTLNPIPHIDPIGTLFFPAAALATGAPVFGWAKPTPINAARFRPGVNPRFGIAFTAVAGPISNLLLGGLAAGVVALLRRGGVELPGAGPLLGAVMTVNAALAVFNLIPVPPLDGSQVVFGLLPRRAAVAYARLGRFSILLLILLFAVPQVGQVLMVPMRFVLHAFDLVASL